MIFHTSFHTFFYNKDKLIRRWGGRELNALSNKVQEPYRRGGDLAAEGGGI